MDRTARVETKLSQGLNCCLEQTGDEIALRV